MINKLMIRKTMLAVIAGAMFLTCAAVSRAEVQDVFDTQETNSAWVYKGDLIVLKVYSLTRIAIGRPGVVEIANADVNEVLLVGQKEGETPIFIWDEYGKRKIDVRVLDEDLALIRDRIQKLLEKAEIEGITLEPDLYEAKIVVTGRVPKYRMDSVNSILQQFSNQIINMVQQDEGALIQIDAQITELSTTLTQALGFDWTSGGSTTFSNAWTETLPTFKGTNRPPDLFKLGDFSRTTAITATVDALIQSGKARILSKPRIVVTNGEEASFLIGGEIPIRTTTTNTGGTSVQENVSFKEYGIDMTVSPKIQNDKINVTLNVSIRDIDAANAVGDDVAFTTREANTILYLNDGQTIVLAGLIKHNENETIKRIPVLSAIPIIGYLFRHKSTTTPQQEQEIVIMLTPRILTDKDGRASSEAAAQEAVPQGRRITLPADEAPVEPVPDEAAIMPASVDRQKTEQALLAALQAPGEDEMILEETSSVGQALSEQEAVDQMVMDKEETELPAQEDLMFKDQKTADAINQYVQDVQKKIAEAISFPYEAKQRGWEGTVKLMIVILSDGTLNKVAVKETSGHAIFDKDAVNTAKILSPYDPFPIDINLDEIAVTIPIVYSQRDVLDNSRTAPAPEKKSEESYFSPEDVQSLYEEVVMRKLVEQAVYPHLARANGWEGRVKLNLKILRDGQLADVRLTESSGNDIIDQSSLQLARDASPYEQFPASWKAQEVSLTIPLVYQLEKE